MVYFSCGSCGDSLKKNQVEKHCATKCRQCEFLSCVDCGVEFWGNDYISHIKCISEEEKTHGSLYKPKTNKGEQKQDLWTQQVLSAIEKAKGNHSLQNVLVKLQDYSNIPRKKAKFENFVKNSLRIYNDKLLSQVWDAISAETENKNGSLAEGISPIVEDKGKTKVGSPKSEPQIAECNGSGKGSKKRKTESENNSEPESKKQRCEDQVIENSSPIKWKSLIVELLKEAPEKKMSLKKLRKKFTSKLKAQQSLNLTKEELMEKLNKKLSKHSRINVSEDIVTLLE